MRDEDIQNSAQARAFAFIAHESRVSVTDVAVLYGTELTKLEGGARLRTFLPIFAIRNVRDLLHRRSTGQALPVV